MKRFHFPTTHYAFFAGLLLILNLTPIEVVFGQKLVATGRLTNLTITTTNGQTYNWGQFPTFTAPSGKIVVFSGAGRLSGHSTISSNFTGFSIFNRGFTHINHNRMTRPEQGTPANWYSGGLSKSQRAYFSDLSEWWNRTDSIKLKWVLASGKDDPFMDYYENTSIPNQQWGVKALPGYTLTNGNLTLGTYPNGYTDQLTSYDLICWDIERGGNRKTSDYQSSILFSASPGLGYLAYSADSLKAAHIRASTNRYVYLLQQTKARGGSETWVGSYDIGGPASAGYSKRSNYSSPTMNDVWTHAATRDSSAAHKNFPTSLVGKYMDDYTDFITSSTYFQISAEFDKNTYQGSDSSANFLATLLAPQEINKELSSKPRIPVYWLLTQKEGEVPISERAAETTAVFPWFTDIKGMILWDNLTIGVQSGKAYGVYEHFLHGLYRLFYNHKDMLESGSTYLQKGTDFKVISVTNGDTNTIQSPKLNKWVSASDMGGSNGSDANVMKTLRLPFVRAIQKDCEILVAACYPYASSSAQTKLIVRNAAQTWSDTITLNGDELYLGRATMKPSIEQLSVSGNYNLSTPIYINSYQTYTIAFNSTMPGATISYSVLYPSGSSVSLSPSGTSCNLNSNGQTGSFTIRISISNSCGSATRDLVFLVQSGYRVYSNPTKDYLNVTFDNAKNIEGLPDNIELLAETSTKSVKSVTIKEVYDKNAFKNGNTVEFDVRDLPRGTYYLHLKYSTPASILAKYKDAQLKSKTEVVRVLIN